MFSAQPGRRSLQGRGIARYQPQCAAFGGKTFSHGVTDAARGAGNQHGLTY
jgi:hypothetical protein